VREPLVDVFDEGETMIVIAELPGVEESEVRVEVHGDVLSLETTGERRYAREVLLPAPALPDSLRQTYRNGILELRLTRQP
jgi:HSP20 family protein